MSRRYGMQWTAQIEEKGAAGVVVVGEEDATCGHDVFGVVHEPGLLIGVERGEELAIVRRRGRGIDDGEEVGLLSGGVAGPDEEILWGCIRGLVGWRCGERWNRERACEKQSK